MTGAGAGDYACGEVAGVFEGSSRQRDGHRN